ncbi:MAG: helix-turn-helix transcriptional regulator [Theionarchaea archaeon]|nr:helix-turn-helix transcriptional regulator [Theionarchaea archaeon]
MVLLNGTKEVELTVEILDFARCHGRKITEEQAKRIGGSNTQSIMLKLLAQEYLLKVERKDILPFYTITSRGLNLFGDVRRSQQASEPLKKDIGKRIVKAMEELDVKPWEIMVHIIHVVGKRQSVTTGDVEEHFNTYLGSIKGVSRASIYRNLKHLRMKGYIEYEKKSHVDQSQYRLSKKGEEIFYMTRADAASKLRTSEEWDTALKRVLEKVTREREEDNTALFHALDAVLPDGLDNSQITWALYTLGCVYELKGDLARAEAAFLRMEGICGETGDSRGKAYALKELGNVSYKRSSFMVAEQYYTRCERTAEDIQDTPLLSDVLNNLGSCSYMNDDIDDALALFERALTLAGKNTFRIAGSLYNKGLCHARKEELTRARGLWEKSLSLYEQLDELAEIRKVKRNLREIDIKQKREFLEEKYREALQTGTSDDIKGAYNALVRFEMDLITPPEE